MTVYTQGSFDILHSGHILLLRRCKRLGNVTVSLLSDEAYEAYRGYPPVMPFDERKTVLESLRFVDLVIRGDNRRTRKELEAIRPSIVAVGSDWVTKDIYRQYGVTQEWLDDRRIELIYFPYTNGISSTMIKEALSKR